MLQNRGYKACIELQRARPGSLPSPVLPPTVIMLLPTVFRMLVAALPLVIVPLGASAAQGASPPSPSARPDSPAPQRGGPLVRRGLCGPGMLHFNIGGAAIGQETYQINCLPNGGYEAGGRTELGLPSGTVNVGTTMVVDSALRPTAVTVNGTAGATSIDQRVLFGASSVTVTANGATRSAPQRLGAAWLGSNVYYSIAFLVARYDSARGGVQTIPTFPALPVTVEHEGRDDVRASDTSDAVTRRFERYGMRVGAERVVVWLDSLGRLALIAVPSQRFTATQRGYEPYAAALSRTPGAQPPARAASAPDYSAAPDAPYASTDVVIPVAGYVLSGTLLVPKQGTGRYPAVVLITGSGQQTRDEALPIPGLEQYRPFRQIADALASAGIAVLRVDDRGAGESSGGETVAHATTSSFAQDARAQVAWLRRRSEIDPARIALVGHSEGALIAPMIAASDPRVAAVVLIAGMGRPGEAVLRAQLDDILARDTTMTREQREAARARQRQTFQTLRAGREVPGLTGAAWLREFLRYDPLPTIRRVRQPILLLQGELDRQVSADNATLLAEAAQRAGNPDVTVRVLPGLNHLLLAARTGAVAEYSSLTTPEIGDDVLGVLRDWLVRKLKAK